MKPLKIDLEIKESYIAVVGVIVTVILYIMNVLGTGVIVGGDVGHIDTGNDFYACMTPAIWTVFAVLVGYLTKRNSMTKAFKAIYITMLLPFASYLPAAIGIYLPFIFVSSHPGNA